MTCVQVILSKNFNSTNMVKEKDKHECNKKLIDEGNEEEEQESNIFLKKRDYSEDFSIIRVECVMN